MKFLLRAHCAHDASTVEFVYVELTPEVVELLRQRVEYIRHAVEVDASFLGMSFAERSPDLIFRLQDDLRPFAVGLDTVPFAQLPETVRFSPNTEQEEPRDGILTIDGKGFSWELRPQTARYTVETGRLPWSILEEPP
jgi:hypothetical protein